jgi:hypothetical protein
VTLYTIVAFDTIVDFDIPFVAMLTSSPVIWRKEHVWNVSVLQRVHLFILVCNTVVYNPYIALFFLKVRYQQLPSIVVE